MSIDDPKTRYKAEPSMASVLDAMMALIQEIRTSPGDPTSKERLALEAERLLLEQERLKRDMPENKQHPGMSVYSYPEGDLKHPKPPLKTKMFWVGYEMTTDTLTPIEVELLNQLEPGNYRVTKADGTLINFDATPKYRNDGTLEEMAISFPCKGDNRHNHGSKISYLQQALGTHIPTQEELMKELTKLKEELRKASVGVTGMV